MNSHSIYYWYFLKFYNSSLTCYSISSVWDTWCSFPFSEIWDVLFGTQLHVKLRKEAADRGEKYKITKLRRNVEMDEYDYMHWRRSFEEREALTRDISWYYYANVNIHQPNSLLWCINFYLLFLSLLQSQSSWSAIGRARKIYGC